jgi:hypothetical protein
VTVDDEVNLVNSDLHAIEEKPISTLVLDLQILLAHPTTPREVAALLFRH